MAGGCSLIVLAGGQSRRMGRDKAGLPAGDETLLERIITRLTPVVDEVILAGGAPLSLPNGVRSVADRYPDTGPLAGIHAGLLAAMGDRALVVACDYPDIDPEIVRFLQARVAGVEAVVPRIAGQAQGLCALYRVGVASHAERLIAAGERRVNALLEACAVRYLDEMELRGVDPGLRSFRNLNTPADYEEWVRSQPAPR
ncbi:MAG: molybdenum cofactor guanylyltransferase [Candidatus Dormibacter sp.]